MELRIKFQKFKNTKSLDLNKKYKIERYEKKKLTMGFQFCATWKN